LRHFSREEEEEEEEEGEGLLAGSPPHRRPHANIHLLLQGKPTLAEMMKQAKGMRDLRGPSRGS
jgi:hypothetical protein